MGNDLEFGKGNKMNIPMVICGKNVVNKCDKCGYVFLLAKKGQQVRLGKYRCPNCGEEFTIEADKNGKIFILLSPINNTGM